MFVRKQIGIARVGLLATTSLVCLVWACQSPNSGALRISTTQPDMSPIVSGSTQTLRDVAYVAGGGPQQRLDVYTPVGGRGLPVVMFFHGGEWHHGDKREVRYKPRFLNERGIVFVSVNYRLMDTAQHPAQANDVASAVRWVHDHAAEFGGDPAKIVLMGHSAGCHLVTLVGLDPRWLAGVRMKPSDLAGVVSWSGGAFDLVLKVKDGGLYAGYIRRNFGKEEAGWRDASPMAHVGDGEPMPRFLFVSAEGDRQASKDATQKMVGLIRAAGGQADFAPLPGKDHRSANQDLGKPGDPIGDVLVRFVREAAASSRYISQGKHFRRVLLAGMKGVFRQASQCINQANDRMAEESKELAWAKSRRAALVGEFQSTREVVEGLSKASVEIGNVVSVISTVAGQTNLLALNAAIEAARVGELGKGFAVVAGEVKSLAQKTAGATSEIQKKVRSIQEATTAAVGAIDRIWLSFKEDLAYGSKAEKA